MVLHTTRNIPVGFVCDRKEVRDHGEGGSLVGVPIRGRKVLILDDTVTAGTATRDAISIIQAAGGEVVGVIQCLDRKIAKDGGSTVKEINAVVVGEGRVKSILKVRDLIAYLEKNGGGERLEKMRE